MKLAVSPSSLVLKGAPRAARRTPRRSKAEQRVIDELQMWRDRETLGDCPLPALFRGVKAHSPRLTIGQFHDALRSLHEARTIYLHPWTGPLYELPEPSLALLAGHEIAYYASLREGTSNRD
jgi:hypothetical protein